MHPLVKLRNQVKKTHKGLENLVMFEMLCVKAKKCCFVVAPSGTGKSTVSNAVSEWYGGKKLKVDVLTRTGLKYLVTTLTGFDGLIVVDDYAKCGTDYARKLTAVMLAELCFSHYFEVHTAKENYVIQDFFGSAIINAQPVVFNAIVRSDEWEGAIRDKVLRYYHLLRPVKPNLEPIVIDIDEGISISDVKAPNEKSEAFQIVLRIARELFSTARARIHVKDLLKASAAYDGRNKVKRIDYKIVATCLRQAHLEKYVLVKKGFETKRNFDHDLYCLLVELATYKEPTVEQVCLNYGIAKEFLDSVVLTLRDYVYYKNSPRKLAPTKKTIQILKEAGYYEH